MSYLQRISILAGDIEDWQERVDYSAKTKLPAQSVQEKTKNLSKLKVKSKLINGKLHYLLHRGVGLSEFKTLQNGKTIGDLTSWSTDLNVAKSHGEAHSENDEMERSIKHKPLFVSAWMPIEAVHSCIPDNHYGESEVLVLPESKFKRITAS
jgi:hypothetical protein